MWPTLCICLRTCMFVKCKENLFTSLLLTLQDEKSQTVALQVLIRMVRLLAAGLTLFLRFGRNPCGWKKENCSFCRVGETNYWAGIPLSSVELTFWIFQGRWSGSQISPSKRSECFYSKIQTFLISKTISKRWKMSQTHWKPINESLGPSITSWSCLGSRVAVQVLFRQRWGSLWRADPPSHGRI